MVRGTICKIRMILNLNYRLYEKTRIFCQSMYCRIILLASSNRNGCELQQEDAIVCKHIKIIDIKIFTKQNIVKEITML